MITKQDAAILFAYGFKLVDKEGKEHEIVHPIENGLVIRSKNADDYYDVEHCDYNQIGTDYWILKRPNSQLTKSIVVEGEKIKPLMALAKVAFPDLEWNNLPSSNNLVYSTHTSETWFAYDVESNCFQCGSVLGRKHLPNQQQLFQKLYSLHFINLPEGTYREINQ